MILFQHISMQDASIWTDDHDLPPARASQQEGSRANRKPPPPEVSPQEGSRVRVSFGDPLIVTHKGIRKRACRIYKMGSGYSLILKYYSQNPNYPNLIAYDLVPAS